MATVEKRGNTWRLVAYDGYNEIGKQIRRYKTIPAENISKKEAVQLANEFEMELSKINTKSLQNQNITLNKFVDYWRENYGNTLAITTQRRHEELLYRILALIGHIRLQKLSIKHVHLFLKELSRNDARMDGRGALSSRTISMHLKLLTSILNKAVKWQFIKSNPCDHVDKPKVEYKPTPILQQNELARFIYILLTTAPLHHQLYFMLGLTDGLRRSEILGLDESNIDLTTNTITINTTAVINSNNEIIYQDKTKTEQSKAKMFLSPIVADILERYINERKERENELKIAHRTKLFTNIEGKPYTLTMFTHWLNKFCKRHKLPHLNTRSMRKMAITYSLEAVNMKEASQFGRHTNISTTAKYYTEVLNDRLSAPTMHLDNLIRNAIESEGKHI